MSKAMSTALDLALVVAGSKRALGDHTAQKQSAIASERKNAIHRSG
jgi:hypothetical protein